MLMASKILSLFPGAKLHSSADDFELFWSKYPRLVAKLEAMKAFDQMLHAGHLADEIIKGAECFKEQCRRESTEKKFVPHPATWLRQGRWMDEELKSFIPLSPEEIAENKDKVDRILRRGKYAPSYQ